MKAQKFKVLTNMYHTLKKGDILVGYQVQTMTDKTKRPYVKYLQGKRMLNEEYVPWVFPKDQFELINN